MQVRGSACSRSHAWIQGGLCGTLWIYRLQRALEGPLTVMYWPSRARVPRPGSHRRRSLRMLHAHRGVCSTFGAASVTRSISSKTMDLYDLPPVSPRLLDLRGGGVGEVSDPPFFVPRTSRKARPCSTPLDTSLPVGGGAHFSVTTPVLIPAGRPR